MHPMDCRFARLLCLVGYWARILSGLFSFPGIPTQGLNLPFLRWQEVPFPLSHQEALSMA